MVRDWGFSVLEVLNEGRRLFAVESGVLVQEFLDRARVRRQVAISLVRELVVLVHVRLVEMRFRGGALSGDARAIVLGGEHRFFELAKRSSHRVVLANLTQVDEFLFNGTLMPLFLLVVVLNQLERDRLRHRLWIIL